jgi:alpha-N-arabinofuranosidase
MANVAQTINCLHSLFLAHEDKFVRTPVYYVFQMYRPHMNGKLVPIDVSGADETVTAEEGTARMALVYGSASVNDARTLTVTLTNPSLEAPVHARLRLEGATTTEVKGQVLTHEDRQAANTFAKPNEVSLAPVQATVDGQAVRVTIPKQAVVSLSIGMA